MTPIVTWWYFSCIFSKYCGSPEMSTWWAPPSTHASTTGSPKNLEVYLTNCGLNGFYGRVRVASQYIPNLCLICTCRRAGPNPLVDLPRHGSFSVQIFTSFGVQVLCSDFAAVLETLVLTPASYKKLKFSLYALPSNMAAPALHLADNRFPTNSLPPLWPCSLHSDLSDV